MSKKRVQAQVMYQTQRAVEAETHATLLEQALAAAQAKAAMPATVTPIAPPPPPKPLTRREELRVLKANPRCTQWDIAIFCNEHGDELMAEVDAERRGGSAA